MCMVTEPERKEEEEQTITQKPAVEGKEGSPVSLLSKVVTLILGLNPTPFTLGSGTNTFLVGGEASRKRILIDAGDGRPAYRKLLEETLRNGNCTEISDILITHSHPVGRKGEPCDHSGGIASVTSLFPEGKRPRVWKFIPPGEEAEEGILPIRDGQEWDVPGTEGSLVIRALHTPGHTLNHCCFLLTSTSTPTTNSTSTCTDSIKNNTASALQSISNTTSKKDPTIPALFTGDLIVGGIKGTAKFTNLTLLMESLKKILNTRPVRLYTGKGPVLLGDKDEEKKDVCRDKILQVIDHRYKRETQILELLKKEQEEETTSGRPSLKGISAKDLTMIIYQGLDSSLFEIAQQVVEVHLLKLVDEGRVLKLEEQKEVLFKLLQ